MIEQNGTKFELVRFNRETGYAEWKTAILPGFLAATLEVSVWTNAGQDACLISDKNTLIQETYKMSKLKQKFSKDPFVNWVYRQYDL